MKKYLILMLAVVVVGCMKRTDAELDSAVGPLNLQAETTTCKTLKAETARVQEYLETNPVDEPPATAIGSNAAGFAGLLLVDLPMMVALRNQQDERLAYIRYERRLLAAEKAKGCE